MAEHAQEVDRAAADSVVPASEKSPFPTLAEGQQRITLAAGDYKIMRLVADLGVKEMARRHREKTLGEAVADGLISEDETPVWRARYNANPRQVQRELRDLRYP